MKRRMIATLLALSIPFTLLMGCGSQSAAERFFDTLEEIRDLEDYYVELTISSDEAFQNGLRISGDVAKSNDRAQLTMTAYSKDQEDKGELDIVVDGSDFYVKADDWTHYVAERYKSVGEGEVLESNKLEGDLLEDTAKTLGSGYYKVTAPEKVFDFLSGSSQEKAAEAFSAWYDGLRTELKGDIQEEDGSCTLVLQEEKLQEQMLVWLENLLNNEDAYRDAVQPILQSVEDSVTISGWTDSDILDNIWSDYQERNDELSALKEAGQWNDWSLVITNGEKGSDGAYQVSVTWKGNEERYIQANITPTEQAAEISVPDNAADYSDRAEELAVVFMDSKNLPNIESRAATGQDPESGEEPEIDWDLWGEENQEDDTKDYSSELELSELKGYSQLKMTPMESEDGVAMKFPVVTNYDYCEASYSGNGNNSTALYLSSDSWDVDVYNIDAVDRTLEEILSESIDTYVTTYRDDWGYEITQEPSEIQKNSDGSAYVAGFSYYDEDKGCEVTLISLVTEIKGSSYAMDYELALFSDAVQEDNCTAVKELCNYFDLDVPVTIARE